MTRCKWCNEVQMGDFHSEDDCAMNPKNKVHEPHNEAFKRMVLENPMFDEYDRNIINAHLSNFYCVFQLGYDEGG